jgi:4a-hydroxytetrahydrobiopterin dehydratase
MAATLAEQSCTPCRGGIPPLSREAAEDYHRQAPEWGLLDEATRIERTYRFKNFAEAFTFTERAAALAEAEGHHPDICFGWGYAPRKSRACTKTISSWRRSSTASPSHRRAESGVA